MNFGSLYYIWTSQNAQFKNLQCIGQLDLVGLWADSLKQHVITSILRNPIEYDNYRVSNVVASKFFVCEGNNEFKIINAEK